MHQVNIEVAKTPPPDSIEAAMNGTDTTFDAYPVKRLW